jgi:hypothetical protein
VSYRPDDLGFDNQIIAGQRTPIAISPPHAGAVLADSDLIAESSLMRESNLSERCGPPRLLN